ncbi:TetR/AcrR family transcriptional regulator [Arthrobacter glacialis]|uniref:TetR family transcriptional regulator n=1 Tax=Arthrobacter glacialis TaxID=1664 RepID=A0A2S3ZX64_ARTGL|nr:TetR/AcrR family transcriptional regulator [Arthrobacter glacialis]POH59368.1 TetR family transcriptional regulator [Arthrobacter glacialis]POH73866.1 TetR family transcriptional regulator [Arthrobacter glacialis]
MEPAQRAVQERRRAGRPSQAVLSSARITKAALKLVSHSGYKGLTMAALAKSLNVAPSALYNHVHSKQDVLLLVEDHLMGRVDVSAFTDRPWVEAVSIWAHSYRNVFAAHLPLIPVIALLPVTNAPKTITMYEAVTNGFLAAGWPPSAIIDAIVALESFIYGSAYDANAPGNIFDTGTMAPAVPNFSAAVARRGLKSAETAGATARNDADAAFELGLAAMVAGLAATLT